MTARSLLLLLVKYGMLGIGTFSALISGILLCICVSMGPVLYGREELGVGEWKELISIACEI